MNYNYVYCIKDGVFSNTPYSNIVSNFNFSKKGKCYRVFWQYSPHIYVNFPNYFINEQKHEHFFGNDSEDTSLFFKTHFKTPEFKHLIIEKKM
jgi:hypothetical protein